MKATALTLLQLFTIVLVDAQTSAPATVAPYCVGLEVDGTADEWESCGANEITLDMMQVGSVVPSAGTDTLQRALRVRFANDGTNIYVLAQVDAPYYFNLTGGNEMSHSFSVMWRVGESATMLNMGGCPISGVTDQYDCSAVQAMCNNNPCDCANYLTDVWHMETSSPGALPGVQYPYRGPVLFPNSDGTYSSYAYNPLDMLGRYQPAVERLFSGDDHTSKSEDESQSIHVLGMMMPAQKLTWQVTFKEVHTRTGISCDTPGPTLRSTHTDTHLPPMEKPVRTYLSSLVP